MHGGLSDSAAAAADPRVPPALVLSAGARAQLDELLPPPPLPPRAADAASGSAAFSALARASDSADSGGSDKCAGGCTALSHAGTLQPGPRLLAKRGLPAAFCSDEKRAKPSDQSGENLTAGSRAQLVHLDEPLAAPPHGICESTCPAGTTDSTNTTTTGANRASSAVSTPDRLT